MVRDKQIGQYMITTVSMCPQCYMEIPAQIFREEHGIWMLKKCPIHGEFSGLVERDPMWFDYCQANPRDNIYNGILIDVTSRCNIQCKYCYHDNGLDRPSQEVINEAITLKELAPIILTGGEPTLHDDLLHIVSEVSKQTETWVLTNGVKFSKWEYFHKFLLTGLRVDDVMRIGLSFHKEANGKDMEFIELLRAKKLKLGTCFYVIDDLNQISDAIQLLKDNQDVLTEMRIKAASNLWNENKAVNKIYTSDMLKYLCSVGKTELVKEENNKLSYANVIHEGLIVKLISWYDVKNIDLIDINCPPFYKSKNGSIYNLVTACLKNKAHQLSIISNSNEDSKFYKSKNKDVVDFNDDSTLTVVRRANQNDVADVSYLWEEFIKESMPNETPNRELWVRQTKTMMNDPDFYIYIAKDNGKIVGFQSGSLWHDAAIDKLCVIGGCFYVKPEYRNTYIASKLHRNSLLEAKNNHAQLFRREVDDSVLPMWTKKGYYKIRSIVESELRS